jgi:LuxR family maltose regulon positive regulatory protein
VDVLLARLSIAQGLPDRALELLDEHLAPMKQEGRQALVIELQLLRALALQLLDDLEQALAAVEDVLAMTAPEGYVRVFVDEGPPMASLLRAAAARGLAPEHAAHVARLLTAFSEAAPSPQTPTPAEDVVEPLSEREIDVLRLVAEGLTNREISTRLHLSLSTVKWHTGNIYGKMGVKNRTQAVARARSLGLL